MPDTYSSNHQDGGGMQIQWPIIAAGGGVGLVGLAIFIILAIRYVRKRRLQHQELNRMMPPNTAPMPQPSNKYSANTVGVKYHQPIAFTLPTITVDGSNKAVPGDYEGTSHSSGLFGTESDTDRESHSSFVTAPSSAGSGLTAGNKRSHQRVKSMERYYISADEIEPELYMSESDDAAAFKMAGLGRVGFSLQYNIIRQQLCVKVIGATGLPTKFLQKGTANPFVKLVLHPEKSPKYLTKVQRNTTNPVFQEMFVFPAKLDDIENRTLWMSVWDYDKFSRKVPIGGVSIPLKDVGIDSKMKEDVITEDIWRDLSSKETERQARGELMFSLSYKPDTSTLTVVVIKTKNLKWSEVRGEKEHVYVKIRLMEGKKLIKSRKTPAVRRRAIPEFDYTFSQYIPPSALNDVTIDLYVYIKSGFSGKQFIGRTQVGNNSDVMEQGIQHWTDMMDAPRSAVAQWHSVY